jgi:putative membrane protein
MKNTVLSLMAVAALMSCNKKETTSLNTSGDSTMATSADSGNMAMDSTNMPMDSSAATESADAIKGMSAQDKKFADAAAKGGMMEVMLGKLAATNASNAAVKSLGAMMVKDHSTANEELKKWAASSRYSLPAAMDTDQQKMYDDLKSKKGSDFDKVYAELMVNDHKKDIAEFKEEATNGTDASLKAFAGKTVPTLEHHLMESEKAWKAVK